MTTPAATDPGTTDPVDPVGLAQRVRAHIVAMTHRGKSSHVASGLSVTDVLAVLYARVMRYDPADPQWPARDRLIFSKGHAGAALYAVLAESGFFPVSELASHCQNGSKLSGHVSHRSVPGVELSTGSLGHGLSVGAGLAYNAQRKGLGFRTFVVMSDGECDEGSIWEAALFAAHHKLGSLTGVVDANGIQSLTTTTETLNLEPFADKWRAFGWDVVEVDGHDAAALEAALSPEEGREKPRCVIARTVKGKGVSFMEHQVLWHYRPPSADDLAQALQDLGVPREGQ